MEGSVGSRKRKPEPGELSGVFANAGLSPKAGAGWGKLLKFSGKYKCDIAEASKFWSDGASFLAKLPKKPQRNDAQRLAAEIILHRLRRSREDFLDQHSDAIYRKLTKDHEAFLRVDELCYEAA